MPIQAVEPNGYLIQCRKCGIQIKGISESEIIQNLNAHLNDKHKKYE